MDVEQPVEILSDFDDLFGKRLIVRTSRLTTPRVVRVVADNGGVTITEDQAARLRDTLDRWLQQ